MSGHPINKRDLIKYICSGGLRMYDDECSVRWANMPDDERADWLVFFDMCRDEPTHHTEEVIAAITAGLCPRKVTAVRSGLGPWQGRVVEGPAEKLWYFRAGKAFDGKAGTIPDPLDGFTHYLARASDGYRLQAGGRLFCVPVAEVEGWLATYFRRTAIPAYTFKHPAHAWAFLLSFL